MRRLVLALSLAIFPAVLLSIGCGEAPSASVPNTSEMPPEVLENYDEMAAEANRDGTPRN
jgi:hypothetical protein